MDIRDFIKELTPAPEGKTIEAIFDLQKALLNRYVGVEKLPQYPVDINAPGNQIILKDFIARIVEEMGEGYESYMNLVMKANSGTLDKPTMLSLVYNFNEEMADAIHFMVETMLFAGMDVNYLRNLIITTMFPQIHTAEGDLYKMIIKYSARPKQYFIGLDCPDLLPEEENATIQGGRVIHLAMAVRMGQLMWEVTYPLQLARNALKNKPWKQSQMLSDDKVFRVQMATAFIRFIELCYNVGINEESFWAIYSAKNKVNHFRISSRY